MTTLVDDGMRACRAGGLLPSAVPLPARAPGADALPMPFPGSGPSLPHVSSRPRRMPAGIAGHRLHGAASAPSPLHVSIHPTLLESPR